MKASVDRDTCIGCELCVGTCPEVFHMDDENISVAIEGEIPADTVDSAQDAASACPVDAITIE